MEEIMETTPEEIKELSPQEYFESIKEKKHHITDRELLDIYNNCLELYAKYQITGQKKGMDKLMFHLKCIEKERSVLALGINTFVYRDDIEYYIDKVAANTVKIIDLESYEREIPDEIVKIINLVKDEFDQMYIVFTDYTGNVERQVKKERREKDPILFGTFQNKTTRSVVDRFYYLGDWVDEYCDLTLDKMVNETKRLGKREILNEIRMPKDATELQQQLASLQSNSDGDGYKIVKKKEPFFAKVKTFLSCHKK